MLKTWPSQYPLTVKLSEINGIVLNRHYQHHYINLSVGSGENEQNLPAARLLLRSSARAFAAQLAERLNNALLLQRQLMLSDGMPARA
ncbi:MAG: hypothetical protein ACAI35_21990 [Candidatus Methylacidiphilales bacterium]|nr:hypothetical protein [Candidatus Methylacidiphilales bacterium]